MFISRCGGSTHRVEVVPASIRNVTLHIYDSLQITKSHQWSNWNYLMSGCQEVRGHGHTLSRAGVISMAGPQRNCLWIFQVFVSWTNLDQHRFPMRKMEETLCSLLTTISQNVLIRIHVCSDITVRCGQWPSAPGLDQHKQNAFFNFLSFCNVLKATGLFLFQHSKWKHIILSYLLMQHGSDDSASFGVSFKHQCVQIRQERVSDVQDIPGIIGKLGIPGNRVLSLLDNINN